MGGSMKFYRIDAVDPDLLHRYECTDGCDVSIRCTNNREGKPERYRLLINGMEKINSLTPIYVNGFDPFKHNYQSSYIDMPGYEHSIHLQHYREGVTGYFGSNDPARIERVKLADIYLK